MLVSFENSFEQKIGPLYSPNGPQLEFEVVGDRNNFIDLQKIFLEVKCRVIQSNNEILRHVEDNAANSDAPFFVNNILHSLFSECTVSLNGIKIANSNGNYAHKSFLETEFSHGKDAKDTWLKCQGYEYESNPGVLTNGDTRKLLLRESNVLNLYGKIAVDFFGCEKHLLNAVTLLLSFLRSPENFALIHENENKTYKIQFQEANLYVKNYLRNNCYNELEDSMYIRVPYWFFHGESHKRHGEQHVIVILLIYVNTYPMRSYQFR